MNDPSSRLWRLVLAPFALAVVAVLAGCNTTAGLGQDLEAAGEAIEDEAKEQKRY
jgi:predicted small secreted protein